MNDQFGTSGSRNAFFSLAAAVLMAAFVPAAANAAGQSAPPPSASSPTLTQEDLLSWLPPDTESVVAARGPFPFPVAAKEEDAKSEAAWFKNPASLTDIRHAFEELPLELLSEFKVRTLQGVTVALAMQGSRHFRDPLPGFEVMEFEGCSIVVFQNPLSERGDMMVRVLAKKATRSETIAGTKVLVIHEKSEEAEWDNFFALPRPDVLLAANNLSYLQELLERIGQRKTTRAFPDSLPEWRFLNPAARFWGMRHYDRSQAKMDASSPFSADRTFGPGDDNAIGYLYALDPANPRTAVIYYLTADDAKVGESAGQRTVVHEPQGGVKYEGKLRSPAPGVLESTYTLDRRSTLDYVVLTVQVALGRGMYF